MPKLPEENSTPLPPLPVAEEPSRRPILDYFQMAAARDRFWRIFSSREKMIEGMKTLAWVVPLTLLIWIYAVREQVVQPNSPNVSNIRVAFFSTDPALYVENAKPDESTVSLQLTGPQQYFDLVREKLTTEIPLGLKIDLGSSMGIGENQPVNIVDRIQNMDIFKNNGVTVQLSQPPELRVNIYKEWHKKDVPVTIPPGVTNLSSETRFEPATVTVSGPEPLVTQVDKVVAKLDSYPQLKQPGPHTIPLVPLGFFPAFPQQEKLMISANQVMANLVVTPSDVPCEVPGVIPVYVRYPSDFIGRYDLVLDPGDHSLANINVTGPQQAITAIGDGSFHVQATLYLEPDDTNNVNTKTPRAPVYTLPDGVRVTPADLAAHQIHFTLVPR